MKMKDEIKHKIMFYMEMAFMSGQWRGQVDLEEHMDNEQFATAFIESINSRKTSMPLGEASNGREVKYRLRSDKWRNGVKKTTKTELNNYVNELVDILTKGS